MAGNGGFSLFDKRWVRPDNDGGFELSLPESVSGLLSNLLGQLDELIETKASATWRLFPTAYPHDETAEAEFQELVRADLVNQQREAAALVESTLGQRVLTEEELSAWMRSVNSLRLVLGTVLKIRDETPIEVDPQSSQAPLVSAYEILGYLVDQIVTALSESS